MSTINYAFKELSCKIVYYGAGLCGKTTNLIRIFETIPAKHRGDMVSLATEQDRTLFFDFLPLDLGEVKGFRTKFQLYTVPGQVFYNGTRKLVLRGVDGIVFVVDSAPEKMEDNTESWRNMADNLQEYGYTLAQIPYIIQYNKRDLPNAVPIDELQSRFNPDNVPWFEGVATQGKGVKETLKRISGMVLTKLRRVTDAGAQPAAEKSAERPILPSQSLERPAASFAMAPRSSKGTAFIPAAAKFSASPIDIRQRCDVFWRGLLVGKGNIEFNNKSDWNAPATETGETPHRLNVDLTVALFIHKRFSAAMNKLGSEIRHGRGGEERYDTFGMAPQANSANANVFVWMSGGELRMLYMRYLGKVLELTLAPEGRGEQF